MSLINLHTNLKSLKYGNDRSGGGNSNMPYITTPIPDGKEIFNIPTGDFIVRGGYLAAKNTTQDVLRFTRYFNDPKNPSGFLFGVKQNLLSRLAAKTQASTGLLNEGIYTPLSTLAQISVQAGGIHLNKQGINPFPDTPQSLKTYLDSVNPEIGGEEAGIKNNNKNRLSLLAKFKIYNNQIEISDLGNILLNSISTQNNNILSYTGGPGAPLGIGNTNIKFADQRINKKIINDDSKQNVSVLTVEDINEISDNESTSPLNPIPKGDFRNYLRNGLTKSSILSNSPSYVSKNIEQRVLLGNPGTRGNVLSYTTGKRDLTTGENLGALDKINALPLYQSENVDTSKNINDLVKFRIEVINNSNQKQNTFIHFRAFLNSINDSYDASWDSTQYIGRGEKFYNYTGFDRKVSLSWTVAAQSKEELIPMYKKLNYLASTLAPDYGGSSGYMKGNLIKLTIGGYFYEQPGIITSLTYELSEESTWEIGINDEGGNDSSVKELPHMIKVTSFNFIPIHNFVPRLQNNIFSENGDLSSYGPERYIALATGDPNNKNVNNYDS